MKCALCSAELTYTGGTSSILNQLSMKHPSAFKNKTASSVEKQSSIHAFVKSPRKLSNSEKERIMQAITDMIVKNYNQLSIVESEGFLSLMQIVAPTYKVPCRKTVRSQIEKKYSDDKNILPNQLDEVESFPSTTDTWTSYATESYITRTFNVFYNKIFIKFSLQEKTSPIYFCCC